MPWISTDIYRYRYFSPSLEKTDQLDLCFFFTFCLNCQPTFKLEIDRSIGIGKYRLKFMVSVSGYVFFNRYFIISKMAKCYLCVLIYWICWIYWYINYYIIFFLYRFNTYPRTLAIQRALCVCLIANIWTHWASI